MNTPDITENQADENGWLLIKSAPKDRLILLSKTPHRGFVNAPIKVGGWRADKQEWEIFGGSWIPTHWQDLPLPPVSNKTIED